jgi:diguanylate cyclase (GGDEF)-like protein
LRADPIPSASDDSGADPAERTADLDSVIRFIGRDMDADGAMLAVDGRAGTSHVYSSWGRPLGLQVLDGVAGGGAIGRALARDKPVARRLRRDGTGDSPTAEVLAAPVRVPSGVTGALAVGFDHPLNGQLDNELRRLSSFAGLIGLWLDDSEALLQLLRAACEDAVTGCLTYPTLAHELESESKRALRTGQPLSCLFIDIDRFKQVNDSLGHPTGNVMLGIVGATLRERVRDTDTVGRFGGDEFVVLLPDTAMPGAHELAEVLANAIREATAEVRGGPVEISTGVSELAQGMTHAELLEQADSSLRERRSGDR